MIPTGKGVYIWQVGACGGPEKILVRTKEMGLNWICLKIADGKWKFWKYPDMIDELVRLAKQEGLQVGGWQYVYHRSWSPASEEASMAMKEVERLGLDFYTIDAERQAKGRHAEARVFANGIKDMPVPIGLCSYRFPSYHQELPWSEYLRVCSFHQPQMYWEGAHNPAQQLQASNTELQHLEPLPTVPLGSAYCNGAGWCPTTGDLAAFDKQASVMHMPGVGYWSLDYMVNHKPEYMDEIAAHLGWPVPGPPPTFTPEQKLERLWEAHPELHYG